MQDADDCTGTQAYDKFPHLFGADNAAIDSKAGQKGQAAFRAISAIQRGAVNRAAPTIDTSA